MTSTIEPASRLWRDASTVDASGLSDAGRIDLLVELRRQAAANAAAQLKALSVIGRADPDLDGVAFEIAPALQISQTVGLTRLHQAVFATGVLPETVAALAAGELSELHTRILIESVWAREATVARDVQARVLDGAGDLSPGRFRAAVARALIAADPASAEQRAARAQADRCVRRRPVEDGMVEWWLLLPLADSQVLDTAIDRLAREAAHAEDELTCDQRRADAVAQMAEAVLNDPALLVRHRQSIRPSANVTITAGALFGDDTPGDIGGAGPVPAAAAAELAAMLTEWRILVTDEEGRLLTWSSKTYSPSAAVRGFVLARDRWCTFPGCTARAERGDLDHVTGWAEGGPTSAANLHPLCRRHHNTKTAGHWSVTRDDATGATTWAGPTGHTWTTHPPPLPHDPLPPPDPAAVPPLPADPYEPPQPPLRDLRPAPAPGPVVDTSTPDDVPLF